MLQLPKARQRTVAGRGTGQRSPFAVERPTAVERPDRRATPCQSTQGGEHDGEDRRLVAERRNAVRSGRRIDRCRASHAATLEVLQQEVAACTRCGELATTRTQTVFGVGNPKARLCFLGEAPGADEDRLGEPFVGRGGQLLNKIIEACRLKREDVYILNMLKCRPPGNRNPLPDELTNCRRFLERQLELIQPEFICCLGAVASQNLLGNDDADRQAAGQVPRLSRGESGLHFHPAYLLRNPAAKKDCWDDMKLLMREMGVEL